MSAKSPFLSRKLIMAVVGVLVLIVNSVLESKGYKALDQDAVNQFVNMILMYMGAQGVVDAVSAYKGVPQTPTPVQPKDSNPPVI